MANEKSKHVLVGKIFISGDQKYRVQDIKQDVVFASKMIDDKTCQRGRPSKFTLNDVLKLLGMSFQELKVEVAEAKASAKIKVSAPMVAEEDLESEPQAAPNLPERSEEERAKSLARLMAFFPPSELDCDW